MNRTPVRGMRLEAKFMLTISIMIVSIMALVIFLVERRHRATDLHETTQRGISIARSIAAVATPSLLGYNYVALEQAAKNAASDEGIAYVVLMDKEGGIAGDSRSAEHQSTRPSDPVSGRAAAARDVLVQEVSVGDLDLTDDVLDIAVPVYVEDSPEKWGTVRVGLSLLGLEQEIARTRMLLILIGLLAAAVCLLGARIIARRIVWPVERLARGALAVAEGDLSHRIDIRTGDEIEELAKRFNEMAGRLQEEQLGLLEAKAEVERVNDSLEDLVQIRTRELVATESRYRKFVEGSPVAVSVVTGDRRRFVNPAFCELFECTREEALSPEVNTWAFIPEEDREHVEETVGRFQEEGHLEPTEMRIRTLKGKIKNVELRGAPIEYDGEKAWMNLITDVTAVRSLQERLWQHEKLRALGELAAGVAHDFNNVLGVILGRAQLLRRKVTDEDTLRGLDVIQKAAIDGGVTVKRVQEFARARRGSERATTDWNEILRDVVEITRGRWKNDAERRGIRIQVRTDLGEVRPVCANASELREVLTNLIFNAIDAMPEGGEIVLSSREENGMVVTRITDTGLGMEEDVRKRIFDPFFTTKGTRGMGLGLSVAYGIVLRHEGTLEVESEPGKGATFLLRLPVAGEKPSSAESAAPPDRVRAARILVIDDEEDIRLVLADLLTEAGHHVSAAASGEEGLALAAKGGWDVVVTDIGMPGVSGWDVARILKERYPDLPVGFVTGWGDTLDPAEVERRRIDFVIAKPFDVDGALVKIEAALREARDAEAKRRLAA